MGKGVVLQLLGGNAKIPGIGVLITLVGVELMESLVLILLSPATVSRIHTTINARGVATNSSECTTLFKGSLSDIHTTRISRSICLTTAIFGAESILHEFLIRLSSNSAGSTSRVSTMETVNTWCWLIVVPVLLIIAIG